jgi:hypothetical protein
VALHFRPTHRPNPGFMRVSEPSCRAKCRRWVKLVRDLVKPNQEMILERVRKGSS